jgi:hypothetical protein
MEMEMEASGLQGGLVSGTPCDTHPAEQEANQLRSRYLADEEEAATNNTNRSSSETGRSYGIVDRWRSRGQRIASSFAVADDVEKKRLEGLVIDQEARDTKLEKLFDCVLVPGGCCKRPRCCGKGRMAQRFFVLCQLLCIAGIFWFLLFFWFGNLILELMCRDEDYVMYQCPAVQNRLRAANLTVTSQLDLQIIHLHYRCGINDNDCSENWGKVHFGGSTANHSHFWRSTLSEEERDAHRLDFLFYRGNTMTSRMLMAVAFVFLCGVTGAFYKTLHDDGKGNNVLFPAMLVRREDGRMEFVRRRRYVMECSLLVGIPGSYLLFPGQFFPGYLFLLFTGFTTVVGSILVGMSIQKDNVTALSISLAECSTLEQFVQWKEKLYKPTVALLHSWSQKLSNLIAALYCIILFLLATFCYFAAVPLIHIDQQEGLVKETLRAEFLSSSMTMAVSFFVGNLFQLLLLVGLSAPSMHYNGLNIVFASLALPFYVQDFQLLQQKRGAFTVYGFPITLSLAWQVFLTSTISLMTSVISLTYLNPYY